MVVGSEDSGIGVFCPRALWQYWAGHITAGYSGIEGLAQAHIIERCRYIATVSRAASGCIELRFARATSEKGAIRA
jgi:hypothetical protein